MFIKRKGVAAVLLAALVCVAGCGRGATDGSEAHSFPPQSSQSVARAWDGIEMDARDPFDPALMDKMAILFGDTESVWATLFEEQGMTYHPPQMKLFHKKIKTACDRATEEEGPFYCPLDKTVYFPTVFYDQLREEYGVPGDYGFAYVIAHEVGHHVQNELGITEAFHALTEGMSEAEANSYSVALELQADYFAGVVARYVDEGGFLTPDDIEEAMIAAAAVGDDALQLQDTGAIDPESFTHGTSEERVDWFLRGYEHGDFAHGDTFLERLGHSLVELS